MFFLKDLFGSLLNAAIFSAALENAATNWPKAVLILSKLSTLDSNDLVPYSDVLVRNLKSLLSDSVPRKVQTLCRALWCKLNTFLPRRYVPVWFLARV